MKKFFALPKNLPPAPSKGQGCYVLVTTLRVEWTQSVRFYVPTRRGCESIQILPDFAGQANEKTITYTNTS